MSPLGLLKKTVVVVVALLVVISVVVGGLVATGSIQRPTVEKIETSWGTVTDQRTGIRTTVVVNNPNPVGVPGVVDVNYRATMNGVLLASGAKTGIGLSTGRNVLSLQATIPNDRIEKWWVAHINDGQRSTLTISGTVSGPGGFSKDLRRTRTVETDLLTGLAGGRKVVELDGERFLVLENRQVEWGKATGEKTPLVFSSRVTNSHDHAVTLDGLQYVVTMNGITMGRGNTTEGISVAPGESTTVEVAAALDTDKISEWWVSHLRNGERTNMSVQLYGFVVENGTRKRVPLTLFGKTIRFTTDLLGDAAPTTTVLDEGGGGPNVTAPSVAGTERSWGTVTDAVTPIRTRVTIENPNSAAFSDLLGVRVAQTVRINDVLVARDVTRVESVPPGRSQFVHVAKLNNSKVPRWWARHVNRGEQSTVVIEPNATADVGFTKFDVPLETERSTFRTDMLAGLEGKSGQKLQIKGQTVAVIHETKASWGTATPQRTPFTVSLRVENTGRTELTISKVDYLIEMNAVVVANRTAPESYTIQPGETRWITFTFVIDSQKMDEWWVSHVRNGERTVVDFSAVATISTAGRTKQVDLTGLSSNTTVTTDVLNDSSGLRAAGAVESGRTAAGGTPAAAVSLATVQEAPVPLTEQRSVPSLADAGPLAGQLPAVLVGTGRSGVAVRPRAKPQ